MKFEMEIQEFPCLDARQKTIPKAFRGYGLAFAETSGFEDATRRDFLEEFFLAI